ncbi:hypothetical protein BMG05_16650 [Mycobacterium malmoense]|nr:hypothetical protein BMG05_16650 [Mycobacterium malmoense]
MWLDSPIEYAEGSQAFVGVILFPAGIDPGSTKTAVMVLGPGGGQMNMPAVKTGPPGPTPTFRNVNYTPVAYGDALPDPPAQFVDVLPGVVDFDIAIQQGPPGQSGDFEIQQAQDLSGTLADKNTIIWNGSTSKFNPIPFPFLAVYNVTGIEATGSGAGQVRTLTSVSVPPQPRAWIPIVTAAAAEVVGTANTQVDVVARLGGAANSQSGVEVARGFGRLGAAFDTPSGQGTFMGGLLTSGYGQVAAGDGATIFLNCEQQQATTDTYSTGRAGFTVWAAPVS